MANNEDDNDTAEESTSFITNDVSAVPAATKAELSDNIDGDAGGRLIFYSLVVLTELLGLICLILIEVWARKYFGGFTWDDEDKVFNFHPLFMVLMVFVYGNAAISYRVFRSQPKYAIKLLHATLQLLCFGFMVIGLTAVFKFHNNKNYPNMYSLHSWVGIGTVLLFSCQLVAGFLGFLFPKFSDENRRRYIFVHVFFGAVIFALSIVACVSGLTEKILFSKYKPSYSQFVAPGNIVNSLGVCLVLFAISVAFLLYHPSYKRVENYATMR